MDGIKILFVSNDKSQYETFSRIVSVQRLPYEITFEEDIQRAKELCHTNPDAVVANYWLQGGTVLDLLSSIPLLTPSIVMAEQGSEEHIHQVVHAGATDFIVKDTENRYLNLLPIIIRKALRYRDIQETQEDMIRVDRLAEIGRIAQAVSPGQHSTSAYANGACPLLSARDVPSHDAV